MISLELLKLRIIQAQLCLAEDLNGCSSSQISEIEECCQFPLPEEYKQAMSVIGCNAGYFMSDLDFFYPAILSLTEQTRELISESVNLPEDAFVFAVRYGEQILFFRLDTDPPGAVYKWSDEEPKKF